MNSNNQPTVVSMTRQAKRLKKEKGIPHHVALDIVAKSHGYSNWRHVRNSENNQAPPSTQSIFPAAMKAENASFTQWLARHRNRDSQLGDIAKDCAKDESIGRLWPESSTLGPYLKHFDDFEYSIAAIKALKNVWKSYHGFLKRMGQPKTRRPSPAKKPAKRRIVWVKGIKPLHSSKRVAEKFLVDDKTWISWDGKKALPTVVVEVDERHYTVKFERPSKRAENNPSFQKLPLS